MLRNTNLMIALRLLATSHPDLYFDAMHFHRIFERVHKKILSKRSCVTDLSK